MKKIWHKVLEWNVKNLDGGNPSLLWICAAIISTPVWIGYTFYQSWKYR